MVSIRLYGTRWERCPTRAIAKHVFFALRLLLLYNNMIHSVSLYLIFLGINGFRAAYRASRYD
jgi:hypothetical protein